jgi:hypothetical protein
MSESNGFNDVVKEIIHKSLFTEKQIKIILNQRNPDGVKMNISRGAYYRQVSQCNAKIKQYYYTSILLEGLGIVLPDDFGITSQFAQQISQITEQEFVESGNQVLSIVDDAVNRLSINS